MVSTGQRADGGEPVAPSVLAGRSLEGSMSAMSIGAAMRATRVLEWVHCGVDAGIDRLLHAQPVRAAGAQFVRVRDALALAEQLSLAPVERAEPRLPQGVQSGRLGELFARVQGPRGRADASVSLEQFVRLSHGPTWAGTGGVGAPAQGSVGPVSVRTLVGAARGVASPSEPPGMRARSSR